MRYTGVLLIRPNPPGETIAVQHDSITARLRGLFFYDPDVDSIVRERFTFADVLTKFRTACDALGIDDLTRISQDGAESFFDSANQPADLGRGIAKFLELEDVHARSEGPLQLVLEKQIESLACVLRLDIRRYHRVAEYPLRLEVDGLAAADLETTTAEKTFAHFLAAIEQNLRRVFAIDEIKVETNMPVSPAGTTAATTATATANKEKTAPQTTPGSASLFPLYGVSLGVTTVDELAQLGNHARDKDDDGKLFQYYVVGDMNFWYGEDKRAESIYITHTDGLPNQWRALGFDWDLSYDEWVALLEGMGCLISITTPPRKIRHYSGEHDSFEAGVNGLLKNEAGTLSIELNFNYSHGTTTADRDTLYGISIRLR